MTTQNRFVIRNGSPKTLTLSVEPEGVLFPLGQGEEVTIRDTFSTAPVTVKVTTTEAGDPVLSIWPGDGEVKVEKDGVDVFDLL